MRKPVWMMWSGVLCVMLSGWLGVVGACTGPAEPLEEIVAETTQETTSEIAPQDGGAEMSPELTPDRLAILEPGVIAAITPQTNAYELPPSLQGQAVHMASQPGGDVLLGGIGGLYTLDKEGKFTQASDEVDVIAMTPWKQGSFAVASKQQIYLWDSVLQATLLHQQLGGSQMTALATYHDEALWIGTEETLWLFENERLQKFADIKGVKSLLWIPLMRSLVVVDRSDKTTIMRQDNVGQWQLRDFDAEGPSLLQAMPASLSDYWGLTAEGLWLRRQDGGQAAWWPYRLSPDDAGQEQLSLTRLVIDPKSGYTWVFSPTELFRLEGGDASRMARPTEIGDDVMMTYGAPDGSLWVAGKQKLVRIGEANATITYAQHIKPFLEKSRCTTCHATIGGQAFTLETYESSKEKAARIVGALKQEPGFIGMPPPGFELVGGDAALVERWIKDGTPP